jgi:hypothetical protein
MFIKLTQENYPQVKVRIAVSKILFYMPNPEGPGSILAIEDGEPTAMAEDAEEIDRLIYVSIHGLNYNESTGPG